MQGAADGEAEIDRLPRLITAEVSFCAVAGHGEAQLRLLQGILRLGEGIAGHEKVEGVGGQHAVLDAPMHDVVRLQIGIDAEGEVRLRLAQSIACTMGSTAR